MSTGPSNTFIGIADDYPVQLAKQNDLINHIGDFNNPHKVSSTQILVSENTNSVLELPSTSNVDDALSTLGIGLNQINDMLTGSGGGSTVTTYMWKRYQDTFINNKIESSTDQIGFPDQIWPSYYYDRNTGKFNVSGTPQPINIKCDRYPDRDYGPPYTTGYVLYNDTLWYFDEDSRRTGTVTLDGTWFESVYYITYSRQFLDTVSDNSPDKYPENGYYSDDLFYIRQGAVQSMSLSKIMIVENVSSNGPIEIDCSFTPLMFLGNASADNYVSVMFWTKNNTLGLQLRNNFKTNITVKLTGNKLTIQNVYNNDNARFTIIIIG